MAGLTEVMKLAGLKPKNDEANHIRGKVAEILERTSLTDIVLERTVIQAQEVWRVVEAATTIETAISKNGLPLPGVIMVFTGGFQASDEAIELGYFGQPPFENLVPTDSMGYSGRMSAVDLGDNHSALIVEGRVHPGEWANEPHGNMYFAHNSRVWQELVRRGRDRGYEVPVVLTFLTGVDGMSNLAHGRMGLVMDDSELSGAAVQPGAGPHGLFDERFGSRHQAAVGRSSNPELAKELLRLAEYRVPEIIPALAFGTPRAPEFESMGDTGLIRGAFNEGRSMELLKTVLEPVFGERWQNIALFYGMGITSELAVWRQKLMTETELGVPDFKVLALVLATDLVGNRESLAIDHGKVLREAFERAKPYRDLLMDLARQIAGRPYNCASLPKFSIMSRLKEQG